MTNETRTLIAAFFLMAALLLALPLAADAAPILDWWGVLVLTVVGTLLLVANSFDFTRMTAAGADIAPRETSPVAATLPVTISVPMSSSRDVIAPIAPPLPFEEPEAIAESPDERTTHPLRETHERANEPEPVEGDEEPESEAGTEMPAVPADPTETVVQGMTAAPVMPGTDRADDVAEVLEDSEEVNEQVVEVAEEAADAPDTDDAPPQSFVEPDDLTRIIGIGPKSRDALVAAGIDTFTKLAASNMDTITAALNAANVRIVGSADTWVRQADFASRGEWDSLNDYVAQARSGESGD